MNIIETHVYQSATLQEAPERATRTEAEADEARGVELAAYLALLPGLTAEQWVAARDAARAAAHSRPSITRRRERLMGLEIVQNYVGKGVVLRVEIEASNEVAQGDFYEQFGLVVKAMEGFIHPYIPTESPEEGNDS